MVEGGGAVIAPFRRAWPMSPSTVVAMGKWGAAELNYSSDIDCLFVYDLVNADSDRARHAAQRISADVHEPARPGDARWHRLPGGRRPAARRARTGRWPGAWPPTPPTTQKWGEPWESQALLKARPVAGDADLGERFTQMAAGVVWPDALDPAAIRSIRAMKARSEARVEQAGPRRHRDQTGIRWDTRCRVRRATTPTRPRSV